MGSIRTCVTLVVLALTLSLAATAAAQPLSGPEFIPLATPCRALDTRVTGTPLQANVPTTFQIGGVTTGGADCGVPTTAAGAAVNFTIPPPQGSGWLTAWPSGAPPLTSVVNFFPGEPAANAVDIGLGAGGTVMVQSSAIAHLVIDIYGYFTDVEELAGSNTALGDSALLSNTTGAFNTALGSSALSSNTTGGNNTATGVAALLSNTVGNSNTATGSAALRNNTTGSNNTALGGSALVGNITGNSNTAVGVGALTFSTGSNNIALGTNAGLVVTTGSNNIHIGNPGVITDANLLRIGTQGTQTSTFIAGIFNGTVVAGTPVLVDEVGKLGTVPSSRRVKDDIRGMDEASEGLGKLRPVVFRYKAEPPTGPRPLEYGLIAEEVAEIYPELVVRDKDGQPSGVRYHVLPAMLLNELQRQQRVIETQAAQAREQARLIDELTARLSRLEAKGAAAAGR